MQANFDSRPSAFDILQQLDELPPGIDPDFDASREELEYEFDALRLTIENN